MRESVRLPPQCAPVGEVLAGQLEGARLRALGGLAAGRKRVCAGARGARRDLRLYVVASHGELFEARVELTHGPLTHFVRAVWREALL